MICSFYNGWTCTLFMIWTMKNDMLNSGLTAQSSSLFLLLTFFSFSLEVKRMAFSPVHRRYWPVDSALPFSSVHFLVSKQGNVSLLKDRRLWRFLGFPASSGSLRGWERFHLCAKKACHWAHVPPPQPSFWPPWLWDSQAELKGLWQGT